MFHLLPSAPFEFVLERHRDLPDTDRPVWMLRSLPARTMAELVHMLQTDSGRAMTVVVQAGLVGWRNVANADGSPAVFRAHTGKRLIHGIEITGGAAGQAIDSLPLDVVSELVAAILQGNQLEGADAKN